MIEKKIHYIWFGNEKNQKVKSCIESWKKYLPEYQIIEWSERNIDIDSLKKENKFFKECYDRKLWAYVADYLRVKILYEEGGIYLDTDIEIIKDISPLLENDLFLGFENKNEINMAIVGTVVNHKIFKRMLEFYSNEIWKSELYVITNILTKILKEEYGENLDLKKEKIAVYPREYFYPYGPNEEFKEECITSNTYTIHWWGKSWIENPERYFLKYKHLPIYERVLRYNGKKIEYIFQKYVKKKYNKNIGS